MIKQIILPVAVVAAIVIAVGVFVQKSGKINLNPQNVSSSPASLAQKIITIGSKITRVTIADTKALREKGLSGVKSLDLDQGMLFVFEQKGVTPTFWMKGMLIPLDIIWIRNGKVVKVDKNIKPPAEGTADSQLKIFEPGQPVDYILEVNGGFSDNNGIKVGDSVDLSKI